MSRQNMPYGTATASRHSSTHGTSSAFSSSANPDEDWTQISDLAERRRIQNRIAQRNYRKKLKRRLEDLERRAGSASLSPPQVHAELKQLPKKIETYKATSTSQRQKLSPRGTQAGRAPTQAPRPPPPPPSTQAQFTPPLNHDDETFTSPFDRDVTQSPPLFTYQPYPTPEDNIFSQYAQSSVYRPSLLNSDTYSDFLLPSPMAVPRMMSYVNNAKRESLPEEAMNPFSMSYAAMAGIDMPVPHPYDDSNPNTPPLSHSFDHSVACSEMGFGNFPSTPMSMPPSPPMLSYA